MRFLRIVCVLVGLLAVSGVRSDDGLWLLGDMEFMHADSLRERGLEVAPSELYNEQGLSVKDAVVCVGSGFTGTYVSAEGLVLTSYGAGLDALVGLGERGDSCLEYGYWAATRGDEVPLRGMKVRELELIRDVTLEVRRATMAEEVDDSHRTFDRVWLAELADELVRELYPQCPKWVEARVDPLYGGNRYELSVYRVYDDVRLVGLPRMAVGQLGGVDQGMLWPRQAADFTLFRVYASASGEPCAYAKGNVPLRPRKNVSVSTRGVHEGDLLVSMGYPQLTNRIATSEELKMLREYAHPIVISRCKAECDVLAQVMAQSPEMERKHQAQYRRAQGMITYMEALNESIDRNEVIARKCVEEEEFHDWAIFQERPGLANSFNTVLYYHKRYAPIVRTERLLLETLLADARFNDCFQPMAAVVAALKSPEQNELSGAMEWLRKTYADCQAQGYTQDLEKQLCCGVIHTFLEHSNPGERPAIFTIIGGQYKNDVEGYVDGMYEGSIFGNVLLYEQFVAKPTIEAISKDPMFLFAYSLYKAYWGCTEVLDPIRAQVQLAKKDYFRGLMEMNIEYAQYDDANGSMRLTYGRVRPVEVGDAGTGSALSWLEGLRTEADSVSDGEEALRELGLWAGDAGYGSYAASGGGMVSAFASDLDGGHGCEGSPVLNTQGELVGVWADLHRDSRSSDLMAESDRRRVVQTDVRYILYVIDRVGGAGHLVDEIME